eukprot:g53440.t1
MRPGSMGLPLPNCSRPKRAHIINTFSVFLSLQSLFNRSLLSLGTSWPPTKLDVDWPRVSSGYICKAPARAGLPALSNDMAGAPAVTLVCFQLNTAQPSHPFLRL